MFFYIIKIKDALKKIPTVYINKNEDCYLRWLKHDFYLGINENFPNSKIPSDNPNTTSVSCYVHYKHWNIILCGDAASGFTEESIISHQKNLFKDSDRVILKATHHGASSSNGYNFLEWCHPEIIYVSAAMIDEVCAPNTVTTGTSSGAQAHPSRSALKRMFSVTHDVYWNAINGDIEIRVDGINDATINGAGRNKDYLDKNGDIVSRENEKNVTIENSKFYEYF